MDQKKNKEDDFVHRGELTFSPAFTKMTVDENKVKKSRHKKQNSTCTRLKT